MISRLVMTALALGAAAPVAAGAEAPARGLALARGPAPAPLVHEWTLRHTRRPGIRLWIAGSDVFRRGERARVQYRTERDAYVTLFRVDTDGRIEVLFPTHPFDDNFARGGRMYTASAYGHDAFVVDEYPGVGYVFGVASEAPFAYDAVANGERWNLRPIGYERIHGDPYTALEELVVRLLPPDYYDFDTHLLPYYVERRYDYPRFVCYDCHAHTSWAYWNPYHHYCSSFTLVIWRDPYYFYPSYWYPTRYYGGTRVVYVRPGVVRESRYVFKARDASEPGVQYRDRRFDGAGRRPAERFVRGADLGGPGSVPAPGGRRLAPDRDRSPERPPIVVGRGDPRRRAPAERGADAPRAPDRPAPRGPNAPRTLERPAPRGERPDDLERSPERRTSPGTQIYVPRGARNDRPEPAPRVAPEDEGPRGAREAAPRGRPERGARPERAERPGALAPPAPRERPSEPARAAPAPRSAPPAARGVERPRTAGASRPAAPRPSGGLVRRRPS
jgi:hypothetical protein